MAERVRKTPLTAADLNIAEQFVLWALRTRLEGTSKLDQLDEGFRLAQDRAEAALRSQRSSRGSRFWPRAAGAISICIAPAVRA